MNLFSKFCEIKTMVCLCLFLHILVGIIPKTSVNVLYGIKKNLNARKKSLSLAQPPAKKG
jgi:hypothetical protein